MDFLAVFIKEGFCDCLIQTVLIHSDCNRVLQLYNRADLILLSLGIYAGKSQDLSSIPDGAVIAVPNDATNERKISGRKSGCRDNLRNLEEAVMKSVKPA